MKIFNRQYNQSNTGTRLGSGSRGAIVVATDLLSEKQTDGISEKQENDDTPSTQ